MGATSRNLLGETIRKARETKGLTGADVHRITDIHPTSLSFIERGQQAPSFDQLRRLGAALGLDPARLAGLALKSEIRPRGAKGAA